LIALYGGLLTAYKLASDEERDNRLTEQLERKQRREHALNRKLAELEVEEMMALAEDKAWIEAVERGALTAGEASAAKKAGKTLKQLERERGEDLNGDGKVEGRQAAAPASKTPQHRLEQYRYLRPPDGDRQHPDLVQARIPMDVWEIITREWAIQDGMNPDHYLAYLDEQIRNIPNNRKNGVNP
jgi:hypothetical protein